MKTLPEPLRTEAADWFARMHAPDADRSRAAFAAWLDGHPDRAAAYRQLEQRGEQTRFGSNLSVVRDRDLMAAQVWHRRPAVRASLAASLALVIVGGGWIGFERASVMPHAARVAAFASNDHQMRSIALGDGSRVLLDTGSAVSLTYLDRERHAELVRGRARFSVVRDDKRPFVVTADDLQVTAADGDFDVDRQSPAFKVSLVRGQAEVRTGAASGERAMIWRLRAGQEIVATAGAAPRPIAPASLQWASGMESFDGTRLDDAVMRMNRFNRVEIILADKDIGSRRIAGGFHRDDPRGFADAVAAMLGLDVSTRPDGTLVLARRKKVVG